MIIDCERCEMRDVACDDCVISALLAPSERTEGAAIEGETADALRVLADAGLTPPLRLRLRAEDLPPAAAG